MFDHESVLKRLELRTRVYRGCKCHTEDGCRTVDVLCPYFNYPSCQFLYKDMIDILEPLRVEKYDNETHTSGDCPSCHMTLSRYMRFCPKCGQEVAWDD